MIKIKPSIEKILRLLTLVAFLFFMAPAFSASNAPAFEVKKPIRALHFVLRFITLERARWIVDTAHRSGFNTVIVQLADGVNFDHSPWKSQPNAWSKKEFKTWSNYVESKGMWLIPEIKLLTHQEKFFQENIVSLMYNKVTYDPRKKEVSLKVNALLNELIELLHPKAIHIGHDEVVGWNPKHAKKKLRKSETMLPATLFINDVLRLYAYLKKRNIKTWMWGDMLLSPKEFPRVSPRNLHGGSNGYGKKMRDKLPKDIVINDWHYFDKQATFSTLKTMQKEGFNVVGTVWKREETMRRFSHYAAQYKAYGMMVSTWFYVQRKQWGTVERLIKKSGKIFKKDFPDE